MARRAASRSRFRAFAVGGQLRLRQAAARFIGGRRRRRAPRTPGAHPALPSGADRGLVPHHHRHARAAPTPAGRAQGDPVTATPTRDEAWELVTSMTQSDQLRRHMRSVEAAMRAYARRFGEDEERWAVLGLIHDWDYEAGPTAALHPVRGIAMLREKGCPDDILHAIASPPHYLNVPRDSHIRKALNAVDETSAFIVACALAKPAKPVRPVGPS